MEKGQVSTEFMIIFLLVLISFASVVGLVFNNINNMSQINDISMQTVKSVKSKLIAASLSSSDFSTGMSLPVKIQEKEIYYEILGNELFIKDKETNSAYASDMLPKIDSAENNPEANYILINKTGKELNIVFEEK